MKEKQTHRLYTPSFVLMAAANLFTVSSFGTFYLFPLFIERIGGTKADIGIVMGIFSLSSVICRPWISEMIDRIGRKRSYTLGSLVMTVLPFTYLFFQGRLEDFYFWLVLVRIIHGMGLAICFTSVFTYIADIVPPGRLNEGIGMFGVTGLTGLAAGPLIGEMVIRKFGFPMFFLSAGALGGLGLFSHLPLPESFLRSSWQVVPSFFSVLLDRKILIVGVLSALFGFGLAASGGFVSPFAKARQIAFISLYFVCYSSAAVLTRLFGGRLADRVGEERVMPYALVITAAGLLALIFLKGSWTLAFAGLLTGCGQGWLFPCLNTLAVRDEPVEIRGKITGVFTGGLDLGVLVGSISLGYVGEWAGFQALFLVAGLTVFAGIVFLRFLRISNKPL